MRSMKKTVSVLLSASILAAAAPVYAGAGENGAVREVEYLTRGGYGAAVDDGIYLSWRLLGTEPIDRTFDIYRNDDLIVSDLDATNYIDHDGSTEDIYKIIPHGGEGLENDVFKPLKTQYKDILLDKPEGGTDLSGNAYTYRAYDASAADVDNDGEYEFIIKWDPSNAKDNGDAGYTGNVLLDCYKQNGNKLWRIDLGKNIRAGDHYTQFIVYDFDGDGKAEMAVRTAPGSMDSTGAYVSRVGAPVDGEPLIWHDSETGEMFNDESDMRGTIGGTAGKIINGPDWLTMFNGETGEAIQTVNFYPQRGNTNSWGDIAGNRSERFLGGVAYLDGKHPSLIMSRGYYLRAAMAAYDWDGENFSIRWTRDDTSKNGNLYSNGNHQLSVCDADNDGKDEIVFGSTVVDDDGSILNSTDHGHGDALHVSDFDNDGEQEIFQVHEEPEYYKNYGAEVRKAKTGDILGKIGADGDVGRGIIGNFDDTVGTGEFFSSADSNAYDMSGNQIGYAPHNVNPSFLVWWDGDLSRELLNKIYVIKYDIASSEKKNIESFPNVVPVGKDAPLLSADLFGDWREEICYVTEDNQTLRIFMTTAPTDYKIPTLMHDTQYRTAIAWQNVGYNQPPHPKFYVGASALAENGRYLAPAAGFDAVKMTGEIPVVQPPEDTDGERGPFTVRIKTAGSIRRTLHTYEDMEYMSSLSYAYPKYILDGTTAYMSEVNGAATHYGGSIANVVRDQDITITYKKKYTSVVYLEDLDVDTGKSADVRASNCLASDNKPYTSAYKLKPGNTYTIVVGYNNANRGSKFMADGKVLLDTAVEGVTKGSWGEYMITGVTVDRESAVYTEPGSNNTYDPLDTILIIKEEPDIRPINPLMPDESGMSVFGAVSSTEHSVVLPGVKGDRGTAAPLGYIVYTAPASGTLSFSFEASVIKDSKNLPRVYYCTDFSAACKNNAAMVVQAPAANELVTASLKVEQGKTYYLFGYVFNMTSDFTYTMNDFNLTAVPVTIAVGEPEFTDHSVMVPVNVEDGRLTVDVYTAVYDADGVLKSAAKQSEVLSGEKEFESAFSADPDDRVVIYIWDDHQKAYIDPIRR